jgi:hypothetical protein
MQHAVGSTSAWFDEQLATLLLAHLTADVREGWAHKPRAFQPSACVRECLFRVCFCTRRDTFVFV